MRSDDILAKYKTAFASVCARSTPKEEERVQFLRDYLALLNAFLFERRGQVEIDVLNSPDPDHPQWRRITPYLALWDDYAEQVIGFTFDKEQIEKLARLFTAIIGASADRQPVALPPDKAADSLGGLTPRQFVLIRLMHGLQDFSQLQPAINQDLVENLRADLGCIPDEAYLAEENNAKRFLNVLGGADRNVDERIRYVFSTARMIRGSEAKTAFGIGEACEWDVRKLFRRLTEFPGLKGKKAWMLLRDFYETGVWTYKSNLPDMNIIADNRVMRVALRTGILRPAPGKLFNSLLDQFDFQYGMTVRATEEAFRLVWEATGSLRHGKPVVPYPAAMDRIVFDLGKACCRLNSPVCKGGKGAGAFLRRLSEQYGYKTDSTCPFDSVCPSSTRGMNAPYAIQNNTWLDIFTGPGGGGGLRGV